MYCPPLSIRVVDCRYGPCQGVSQYVFSHSLQIIRAIHTGWYPHLPQHPQVPLPPHHTGHEGGGGEEKSTIHHKKSARQVTGRMHCSIKTLNSSDSNFGNFDNFIPGDGCSLPSSPWHRSKETLLTMDYVLRIITIIQCHIMAY